MAAPVTPVAPVVGPVTASGEPLALALHRLAAKAHAEGVRIIDDVGCSPFACRVTSSRPGHEPYVVNLAPGHLHGCDCPGYYRFQYCKHYALCLEVAGWLPDVESTEGAAAAAPHQTERDPRWANVGKMSAEAAAALAGLAHRVTSGEGPGRISAGMSRNDRRAVAAADLAARYPSLHPVRPEDLAVA